MVDDRYTVLPVPITPMATGIKPSTYICRLLLPTFVNEWAALSEFKPGTFIGYQVCNKHYNRVEVTGNNSHSATKQ